MRDRILAVHKADADLSYGQVAQRLGISARTVRRVIAAYLKAQTLKRKSGVTPT